MSDQDAIQRPHHGQMLEKIARLYEKLTDRLDEVEAQLEERSASGEKPSPEPNVNKPR